MLSALAITYVYDEKYEAQVTLMLKPSEVMRLKQHQNDNEALGVSLPEDTEFKVISQTLTDLVQSDPILRHITIKLHLDAPDPRDYSADPFYERWYYETRDWFSDTGTDLWSILKYGRVINQNLTDKEVKKLHDDVSIDSEDSYVFVLKVRDKGEHRVGTIANEIAHDVVARQIENAQGPAALRSTQLRDRLARKAQEIDTDERSISDLLDNAHTASVQEELDKDETIYAGLKSQLLSVRADISQAQATIAGYNEKLSNVGTRSELGQQSLSADDYRKMVSERLASEISLQGLRDKAASLNYSMDQLHERMQRLPQLQVEYDRLDNDRSRAQHDYIQINDALQEQILQERSGVTGLIIAGPATSGDMPKTPIKIYHVGLAGLLGLLVALGIAFVFGYFEIELFMDPRIPEERNPPRQGAPVRPRMTNPAPAVD